MNPRATLLARRRQALVRRSTVLRKRMARDTQTLQPALVWMDRVYEGWQWLRGNPLVALAGGLGLAVSRPQRWIGLGTRAWSLWKLFQRMRAADGGAARRAR